MWEAVASDFGAVELWNSYISEPRTNSTESMRSKLQPYLRGQGRGWEGNLGHGWRKMDADWIDVTKLNARDLIIYKS